MPREIFNMEQPLRGWGGSRYFPMTKYLAGIGIDKNDDQTQHVFLTVIDAKDAAKFLQEMDGKVIITTREPLPAKAK